MRTYGRVYSELGVPTWVEVDTDANGNDDAVYLTTLIQNLKLNLGESPFYGNCGIPAQVSVVTQVFPDFYVAQIQSQFAPCFAGLTIKKVQSFSPVYDINITTHSGATIDVQVPV